MGGAGLAACALAVGGLDPGGGAGIVADLRAFAAAGVFGCAAVSLTTVQSTRGLRSVHHADARRLTAQVEEVLHGQNVRAVKIGALGSRSNVAALSRLLSGRPTLPVVLDTPLLPTRGKARLLDEDAVPLLVRSLLPLVTMLTVNTPEARALVGDTGTGDAGAERAARLLCAMGCRGAVVKGGHRGGREAVDLLVMEGRVLALRRRRLAIGAVHGTGCTFASLVAGRIARRVEGDARVERSLVVDAVRWAKRVHHAWLARAVDVGGGMRVLPSS